LTPRLRDILTVTFGRREFLTAAAAAACGPLLHDPFAAESAKQKEVPWLDEVQQRPTKLPDAPKLSSLLVDPAGRKIIDVAGWKRRRDELLRAWKAFLRPLALDRPKPKYVILEEELHEDCLRQLVRYESEPGLWVDGYLLRPMTKPDPVPAPGVVVLHSTVDYTIREPAGLEGPSELHFGPNLAQRGIVAFCPRCFLWQREGSFVEKVEAFQQRHPGSLGMAKMLWDAMRGVDLLESLPYVDPHRLGTVGHSLGGKESLYLAAFDERIKVAVSSDGGIGTRFSNWHDVWYLGPRIKRFDFAHEHHELLAMIAPRAFLLLGGEPPEGLDGDRSWPFIAAARGVYDLYGKPGRIGLFNHRKGHTVPPEAQQRTYEWLTTYLHPQ
jgi:Dienelactone hydrolase family